MRLNHDCVRDILLMIESKPYNFVGLLSQLELNKYEYDDVIYSFEKLLEAKFVTGSDCNNNGVNDYLVKSITYNGHEFLDNIRPQEAWDQAKIIISKLGSASLDIAASVAAQVITNLLTKPI